MPDLRQTRKKIKIALGVLAGVDVVALVLLLSPLIGSTASRKQQLNQSWADLQSETRQVEPLKNLPNKVHAASLQIDDFYKKRFASQDSEILMQFGKLAVANGVIIEQAKYKEEDVALGKLQPVEVDANLSGTYVALARFINALERDDMLFVIDNISLAGEQKGPIRLQMKVETYLKAGSAS